MHFFLYQQTMKKASPLFRGLPAYSKPNENLAISDKVFVLFLCCCLGVGLVSETGIHIYLMFLTHQSHLLFLNSIYPSRSNIVCLEPQWH